MTFAIWLAAIVRLAASARLQAASVAGLSLGVLLVVLVVFGYVPQSLPPSAGDFGRASLNLVSLAIPFLSTLAPRLPAAALQDATGLQWDGANYLGIGVWLLLAVAVLLGARLFGDAIRRHKALVIVLVLLAAYAPSNRWYFAHTLLLEYPVPGALASSFDALRATGRLFWPIIYALAVALSTICVRRLGDRGVIVLALAAGIQFVDATECIHYVRRAMTAQQSHELDWGVVGGWLDGAKRVETYPSYTCWYPHRVEVRVLQAQREIEFIASKRGVATNGGRTGRPVTDCGAEVRDSSAILAGPLREGVVYIFFKPAFSEGLGADVQGRTCAEFADGYVCRREVE